MFRARVQILGIKPIIFNKFNIEVIQSLSKKKTSSAGNNPEEWKTSFYHDNGNLYIPDTGMFSALKKGSFYTKVGRGSIQTTWIAAVQIEEDKIYIGRKMFDDWEDATPDVLITDASKDVYVDVRMVANPNTKGRNVRYRVACCPGWRLNFHLLIDDELVSFPQAKKIVEDTGKLVGLCDARTLGYGRFVVEEFSKEQ